MYKFGQRVQSDANLKGSHKFGREAYHTDQLLCAPTSLLTARSMFSIERFHSCCAINPQDVCWANSCECDRQICIGSL